MKTSLIFSCGVVLAISAGVVQAQTKNVHVTENDSTVMVKDNLIKSQIIDPAEQQAGGAPDWAALTKTIAKQYDSVTADRTITKAKIYLYFGRDWPQFTAGIVHYTDNYELANDYAKLSLNAGMIAQRSNDQKELQEALRWSQAAVKSDSTNQKFQATQTAVQNRLSGAPQE